MTTPFYRTTNLLVHALETPACPLCSARSCHGVGYAFPPLLVRSRVDCGLWYLPPPLKEEATRQRYRQAAYFSGGGESGYVHTCLVRDSRLARHDG